jgi:zinc protease
MSSEIAQRGLKRRWRDRPWNGKRFMKKRKSRTSAALVLIGVCFTFLLSSILLMENARAMEVIHLKNGLTCILEKRKDTGVVAVQVWVKVGSRYEDDRIAGITHFIEHLIFKGTETGENYEIAPRIEALGGSINAFTSYDNTVYHIVIPKDSFETGFKLLVDSVKSPAFPEAELEKEKKVVIEEIKMGEDDPHRKLFKELFGASYPTHPYGRPVIGFAESVSAATRSDIVSYYRSHYTPDNMSVVVVGDFDEQRVKDLLEQQFSGIPKTSAPPKAEGSTAGTKGSKVRIVEKSIAESYVSLSYPIGSFSHPDTPALDVASNILSDGDSSRLQSSLKHKRGIATDTDTYVFVPQEKGLFVVTATFKGKDYDAVIRGVDAELGRLAKDGPEPWEIEKAKNNVRASYIYGAETVQGKARQIGNFQTLVGDPTYADKYVDAVNKVSAADIRRVLTEYLGDKNRRSLVALLPKQAPADQTAKPRADVPNLAAIQLDNGLRVVYNKNNASPSFSFMIGFVGGLKEEKAGWNGSFNILSRMLLRGTKDLDAQAIAKTIDALAGGISPVSGRNVFGLSGKFLSKDFGTALGLVRDLLMTTVIREDELKKIKGEVLSDIRRRDDDAVQYTFSRMNGLLFEGHPYALDQVGSADDVTALTAKDIDDLYHSYVTPKGAVLAISGDIDPPEADRLIRSLFADWKGEGREMKKMPYLLASSKEKIVDREMFQTHMIFSFVGPGLIDTDRYAAEVMDSVLSGMGGRIHKKLREENPFAYAVTFFNQQAYESGAMGIYIGTDKTHVKDVERLVQTEIKEIREKGFTDEEVLNAKRYLIGNHYIAMQTNGSIASSTCLDTVYGLQPDFFKRWVEKAEKVTTEDVNTVAKKYLLLDRMVKIEVGPGTERAAKH